MKQAVRAFAIVAFLLLVPVVAGTHNAPGDWTKTNPNDKEFLSVWDRQGILTVEAASETSKPFLAFDQADAGAAQHVLLAEPASGIPSTLNSVGSNGLAQSWELTLAGGAPTDLWLNLSRPIYGRVFWTQSAFNTAQAAGKSADSAVLRFELLSGATRVGGYEDVVNVGTQFGAWAFTSVNIWPEVNVVRKGEPLSLRISRSGGLTDLLIGTSGDRQSHLDIRYTTVDPLSAGLYLEGRRLVSYASDDPSKGFLEVAPQHVHRLEEQGLPPGLYILETRSERPWGGYALLAGFPLVGLLAARGRRGRTLFALGILIAASASGCLSNPAGQGGPFGPGEGEDAPRPTATVTYEEREDNGSVEGVGDIEGSVVDEVGLPIGAAHVSLLGTNNFNDTDKRGNFGFHGIAAGVYRLRIDAKGFGSLEHEVEVRAQSVARVAVTLTRPNAGDPGSAPHQHDEWGGEKTKVLQDLTMQLPQCTNRDRTGSFNTGCRTPIPISYDQPVPPGTGRVEVRLRWTDSPTAPRELMLDVKTGVNHYQWFATGGGGTGVFNLNYVARKSGDPFNVVVFPNEADPGHQHFTNWEFAVAPAAADQLTPSRVPATLPTSVEVEIVAHKAVLPFEPAHRKFWNGRSEVNIINHVSRGPAPDTWATSSFPSFNAAWRLDQMPGALVPPGTKELRGYFLVQGSATSLTNWGLVYRHAQIPPQTGVADYPAIPLQGNGANRTFTLQPTPAQLDQMYQRTSYWWFFVEDEDQPVNSSPRTTWTLGLQAIRDPAWTE